MTFYFSHDCCSRRILAMDRCIAALAAVGFYLEGDRLYLGVSLIVLTILLLSLIHSA
jgi:uncharacterized membrane protein